MIWRIIMNKYEQKLLKIVNQEAIIFELTREIIKETKVTFLDIIFNNIFSLMEAIKELNKKSAYYLVIDNEETELIEIKKDLTTIRHNLKDKTTLKEGSKYFIYEGKRYSLFNKIQ